MRRKLILLLGIMALIAGSTACGTVEPATEVAEISIPTPTVADLFGAGQAATSAVAVIEVAAPPTISTLLATEAPLPRATVVVADPTATLAELPDQPTVAITAPPPEPTAPPVAPAATQSRRDRVIGEVPIYSTELSRNWSLQQSRDVTYTLGSRVVLHDSRPVIEVRPQDDFGMLYFTVDEKTTTAYPRDRILGISFWLNGGAELIENGDLAVAVIGSNAYPHWVPADNSVAIEGRNTSDAPVFSETRLYYLGINKTIPPQTWVEVIVWLDQLQFDPVYDYVTGVYIKNDVGFRQPYYIDKVNLLVQ